MASFDVRLRPSVHKDPRQVHAKAVPRILSAIQSLADDPFPRGSARVVGDERFHRIRVGTYRVIYSVDVRGRQVTVQYVRHRSAAYR
jgi:mRNA interferase RelE/StbE